MSLKCLKLLYTFIQVRQLDPLLGLFSKNNTFGPRSRYRKKQPAAAANQSAVISYIIIYMKKYLHSDWLRAVQFLANTVPKKRNSVPKKEIQCKFL